MTSSKTPTVKHRLARKLAAGFAMSGLVVLAGCAGSAGTSEGAEGEGVEYGAGDEAYKEALADMEPVTLTYQGGGSSADNYTGMREQAFADAIEEKSGGKITLDLVFGQPIADYDEVTQAIADGRIDIGLEIPIYTPTEYPAITSLINITPTAPADAYFNEMVTTAAAQDVAWSSDEILNDFRDKGVDVLVPLEFEYSGGLMCTEPVQSLDDFKGKQIRVASASDFEIAEALGASPLSIQFVETYEALQRGTIDCTFGALKIASGFGFFEVAPHVTFPNDVSFSRNPTSVLTGSKFAELPLAAQQLIFDETLEYFTGHHEAKMKFHADAMAQVNEYGGDVYRLEEDAEAALASALDDLEAQTADSDALDGQQLITDFNAALEKWTAIAEEEGFAPAEDYKAFAEEFESEPISVDSFAQRVFEDVYLAHRPSKSED